MNKETGYLHATDELRKLIIENPELPLLVMGGENANDGMHTYTVCGDVSAEIGEFLDCEQDVNPEICYTSRKAFGEDLAETLGDCPDDEFGDMLNSRIAEHEPYWKPCIILYVDN